jgi:hypothetical protein
MTPERPINIGEVYQNDDCASTMCNSETTTVVLGPAHHAAEPLHDNLGISEDMIIVQDKGKYLRKYAWAFMVMGFHVFDSLYQPLTLKKLEREMNTGGEAEPGLCRKRLWQTTHRSLWQCQGCMVQPGLEPRGPQGRR